MKNPFIKYYKSDFYGLIILLMLLFVIIKEHNENAITYSTFIIKSLLFIVFSFIKKIRIKRCTMKLIENPDKKEKSK